MNSLKRGGSILRAVRTPNWLGDAVMALPALSMLRDSPGGMLIWSHFRVAGLFPVFFPSLEIFTGSRLPRGKCEELLLLTDSFRSAMRGFLSGVHVRVGYRTDLRSILLTRGISRPTDRMRHHSLDYVDLAEEFGASGNPSIPEPSVDASGQPHAAFFAGARYGGAKKWNGFEELAEIVYSRTGLPAIFYGTPAERDMLDSICGNLPFASAETDLDLAELASRLLNARLAVGNDSGGIHLASALGVPSVTVFGSTSPLWTAPLGKDTINVTASAECSPCFKRECPQGEAFCLRDITVDRVLEESTDFLKKLEI